MSAESLAVGQTRTQRLHLGVHHDDVGDAYVESYRVHIGIMEKKMETTIIYRDYIGLYSNIVTLKALWG